MKLPVYMDYQATTPVDPRVLEAMLPFFRELFGNAASRSHVFGREAAAAVDMAREQVAAVINADPGEIVFTSGATESDNLAIKGVAESHRERGDHVVTSAVEHEAVLDACKSLKRAGFRLTVLPVDRDGLIELEALRAAIDDRTLLVTIMAANNEIGVLQPVREIGAICRERGVLFHTDAAQAYGKVPLDVQTMPIDLLSIAGHKIYGPKGVGALYMRRRSPRVRLTPQMEGGGQERGLRSGTLNVPGIVGLGEAARLCAEEMEPESSRLGRLRDRLCCGIERELDGVLLNGHPVRRLAGNLNLSFTGLEVESLLALLGDVALSSGSACTSARAEPSYVLRALGLPDELAHASVRFGLGRFTTEAEVDYVIGRTVAAVRQLRSAGIGK